MDEWAPIVAEINARARARQRRLDRLALAVIFGCAIVLVLAALQGA